MYMIQNLLKQLDSFSAGQEKRLLGFMEHESSLPR
jgi:hypothetical protein